MEELLENCRKLCRGAFQERVRAYHRLRSSRAFALVLHHLRGFRLTSYEVARLLAEGGTDPVALSARRLLEAQFDQLKEHEPARPVREPPRSANSRPWVKSASRRAI